MMQAATVKVPTIRNAARACHFIPNSSVETTAVIPPITSTPVYLADILHPQYLHRPLRLIQEIIGIRSFASSVCLQLGHMDFPSTNPILFGRRYITTLRKENIDAPIAKNTASITTLAAIIDTVSHELRTPLTSIRGFSQTLLSSWDKLDDDNKKKFIKIIEEQERESSASKNNNMNMEMKFLNEKDNIVEDIQEKQKLINYCAESMNQINEITKFQTEKILEAGIKIDTIEDNIENMTSNMNNAVEHMHQAKKYNDEAGGYSNYCLYIIAGIVFLLILLVLIMPSS